MTDLLQYDMRETASLWLTPTTNNNFAFLDPRIPVAAGLLVTGALISGATVTLATGGELVIPPNGIPVGGRLKVRCTKVVFVDGSFRAYA